MFGFTPPPGATVKQGDGPAHQPGDPLRRSGADQAAPDVVGKGWTSVLVATLPADQQASGRVRPRARCSARSPPCPGAWGSGHLLRSALFSAVLTDDGRVAVGAVPPQLLYAALCATGDRARGPHPRA